MDMLTVLKLLNISKQSVTIFKQSAIKKNPTQSKAGITPGEELTK